MILFLLAFVAFLIIGIPISVSIGFSAVLGCLSLGYPLVVIGQKMVSGIDSWLLIAIPLFILAGNLMNAGKITKAATTRHPVSVSDIGTTIFFLNLLIAIAPFVKNYSVSRYV